MSALHGVAVNLVATPRKAKEAIGAVCRLDHADGKRSMVANVEYNQLEPLLKASGFPDGDVNEPDGFSRFRAISTRRDLAELVARDRRSVRRRH